MRLFEAATILTVTLCPVGVSDMAFAQSATESPASESPSNGAPTAFPLSELEPTESTDDAPSALVTPSAAAPHIGGHVAQELTVVPHGNADIWALAGFSVASLGGSLAFFMASDTTDDELAETTGPLLFDRSERIRLDQKRESQRNLGWVLLGTGAATGIGAIWLSIDRRNDDREATVSVAPTNFGRRPGLVVSGRW